MDSLTKNKESRTGTQSEMAVAGERELDKGERVTIHYFTLRRWGRWLVEVSRTF